MAVSGLGSDCVSCEKCKLWGKLQVLGIGTALKVLLASAAPSFCPTLRCALCSESWCTATKWLHN
jgi:hypothetical protein